MNGCAQGKKGGWHGGTVVGRTDREEGVKGLMNKIWKEMAIPLETADTHAQVRPHPPSPTPARRATGGVMGKTGRVAEKRVSG